MTWSSPAPPWTVSDRLRLTLRRCRRPRAGHRRPPLPTITSFPVASGEAVVAVTAIERVVAGIALNGIVADAAHQQYRRPNRPR